MTGAVSDHYNRPDLLARIEKALGEAGKSPDTATLEDLAPHDEFHIGGRSATAKLMPALGLEEGWRCLDVGCATGGVSRYAAHTYGCHVEGVDLTGSFIETGKTINSWLGLTRYITLHRESALDMPFDDQHFDAAWMFHVCMNIEQKRELFAEVFRVLKPGARFLVYDIMRGEDADTPLTFPLPWAGRQEISCVRPIERYEEHIEAAGFAIERSHPRDDIASAFFERVAAADPAGPMRPTGPGREAVENLMEMYRTGRIMPVEILCRRPTLNGAG
ncbi:class I SAM-dependent methyltransferase [Henriciella sp.]|uniref:class I SAM-dependent methyltransferase n=1 Tax=Henriciella sp. TaxID=1968823 RepID=UPI00260FBFFD|nr:class I SAM-dependent methyltransferase [Henriciella sp.]